MLIHKGTTIGPWLFLALFLAWSPAMAQGISVFAWLENDHILVQCDTAPNDPAKSATVKILDSTDKKELASGKTNSEGRFSFPVPEVVRQGHGLLLFADAGQGRSGEWTMSASEIYSAASLAAGFDEAAIQARENSQIHIPVKPSAPGHHVDKPATTAAGEKMPGAAEKATAPQSQTRQADPKPLDSAEPADLTRKSPVRQPAAKQQPAPQDATMQPPSK